MADGGWIEDGKGLAKIIDPEEVESVTVQILALLMRIQCGQSTGRSLSHTSRVCFSVTPRATLAKLELRRIESHVRRASRPLDRVEQRVNSSQHRRGAASEVRACGPGLAVRRCGAQSRPRDDQFGCY